MAPIRKQGNNFLLTINQELVSEDFLQKFLELIEFRALTKQNHMTNQEAEQLSDELKMSWWEANKSTFLED